MHVYDMLSHESVYLEQLCNFVCCSAALTVGFVYNGKASDGVDEFRNYVDGIQSDINSASALVRNGFKARRTLGNKSRTDFFVGTVEFRRKFSRGSVNFLLQLTVAQNQIGLIFHDMSG